MPISHMINRVVTGYTTWSSPPFPLHAAANFWALFLLYCSPVAIGVCQLLILLLLWCDIDLLLPHNHCLVVYIIGWRSGVWEIQLC